MVTILPSNSVHAAIDDLLLRGAATNATQAEAMFLDAHLPELASLVVELDDESFEQHEAYKLLMAHGSRRREDALS